MATKLLIDSLKFGYPAVSVVLGITGTLANAASLTYFIKKQEKGIGDKLLMLLNSIDLLLCITATTVTCFMLTLILKDVDQPDIYYNDNNLEYMSIAESYTLYLLCGIYILLLDGTAFVTCLLSVTRGICIAFPFYQIKGKLLVKVGIVVFVMMVLSGIGSINSINRVMISRIVISSLMILVVVSATVVAVYKLTREDLQGAAGMMVTNNRKATWTVVILSTLFFVFNSILLGATVVLFDYFTALIMLLDTMGNTQNYTEHDIEHYTAVIAKSEFTIVFAYFGLFLAIPFNSAMNPIVYLVRKSDMRQFFSERLPKLPNVMQ